MKDTLYALGQVTSILWKNAGDVPQAILDKVLIAPASGLALMLKKSKRTDAQEKEIAAIIDKLDNIYDPDGGISVEDQGGFWLGYYHYGAAQDTAKRYGAEELRMAGEALFGDRWQTDLTRALGLNDAARIRQWLRGDRPIPVGVWADICALLRTRKIKLDEVVSVLESGNE